MWNSRSSKSKCKVLIYVVVLECGLQNLSKSIYRLVQQHHLFGRLLQFLKRGSYKTVKGTAHTGPWAVSSLCSQTSCKLGGEALIEALARLDLSAMEVLLDGVKDADNLTGLAMKHAVTLHSVYL